MKEEWRNIKQSIIAVTEEMTGGNKKKKKHRNEEWYECWEAIKKNNFARQTMIRGYKRINKDEYDEEIKEAYRMH